MPLFRSGSLWLFRLAGIDVYVHWTWLLMAMFLVPYRAQVAEEGNVVLPLYESGKWYLLQYLALFGIVLLHEFGHALACRKVGGLADTIVLWPLGGIAFVRPPQRPAALLWTAVSGPLVNVLLIPVFAALTFGPIQWSALSPDLPKFLNAIQWLNSSVLLFNLIPVYPLDGGQILQGLLWLLIGRAESLMVVSILGMFVGGAFMVLAAFGFVWLFILAAFVLFTASAGFQHGRVLSRLLSSPRRPDAACPSCRTAPLVGNYWNCHECGSRFDLFEQHGRCPVCGQLYRVTKCPDCYHEHAIDEWFPALTHHTEAPLPPIPSPDRASE
jgi:Zn-dependent protease